MNRAIVKSITLGLACAALTMSSFAATGSGVGTEGSGGNARAAGSLRDVPLTNWSAPQFFDAPAGVTGSMEGFQTPTKDLFTRAAQLTLATFIPITPCRLVDTRGLFSPVYAGGPFAAGQIRVYRASGNCGVPAGNARVRAVSLAVTTPPTVASGDIEVLSESATLGGTVVMVIQAAQWNSATTVTAVDTEGDFKVQLRGTPGDVVIDINGYYASTNDVNNDYISIVGSYALGGGLLYVENNSAAGAAINAVGNTAQVMLSSGTTAIDIFSGGIRVRGAGADTNTTVFKHVVDTAGTFVAGTGSLCGLGAGFNNISVMDNQYLNGNPNAIVFITPKSEFNGVFLAAGSRLMAFYDANCGVAADNHWSIADVNGGALPNGLQIHVMVIRP